MRKLFPVRRSGIGSEMRKNLYQMAGIEKMELVVLRWRG